ncbi:cupin domain-containing protein [Maribacter sp.]
MLLRIREDEVLLKEGDSIFFDGKIPHVLSNKRTETSKMLVVYIFI